MVTKHETKTPETNPETKPAEPTSSGSKAEKKERKSIDLGPLMADANSTLPEGCEVEVSNIDGGGKRIDLVRKDGMIVRLKRDVKSAMLAGAILEGIAIGRRIQ